MDVNRLLDFEHRTGVKDSDIDDFSRKVEEVEAAIKGLVNGSMRPEDIKIKGLESEEEKLKKEEIKRADEAERKRKADELVAKRKREEKERWWGGAELFVQSSSKSASEDATMAEAIISDRDRLLRYTANYSRWDNWIPQDPATLTEEAERQAQEERMRNEEFEKNNAEFCSKFMEDMKAREAATKKKESSADIERLKGNRFFKQGRYVSANERYFEALKLLPYDSKTLTNIAQVYIKLTSYDDALEFLSRTLYLDKHNIKALSRQAFVLSEVGHPKEALHALDVALKIEPNNKDLIIQRRDVSLVLEEISMEAKVKSLRIPDKIGAPEKVEIGGKVIECAPAEPSASGEIDTMNQLICEFSNLTDRLLKSDYDGNKVDTALLTKPSADTSAAVLSLLTSLSADRMLRVYLRTSKLLEGQLLPIISKLCKVILSTANGLVTNAYASSLLIPCLLLLAGTLKGERSSQTMLLMEMSAGSEMILIELKKLLFDCRTVEESPPLRHAVISVFWSIVVEEVCHKVFASVVIDFKLMKALSSIMTNISSDAEGMVRMLSPGVVYMENARAQDTVRVCADTIRSCAFSNRFKVVASECAEALSTVVRALGQALQRILLQVQDFALEFNDVDSLVEAIIGALMALSQISSMRKSFADILSMNENTVKMSTTKHHGIFAALLAAVADRNSRARQPNVISVIIDIAYVFPAERINLLAILMNISIDAAESDELRKSIYLAGGGVLAMSGLRASAILSTTNGAYTDEAVASRSAGLLSRLATLKEVQQVLSQDAKLFAFICRELRICCQTCDIDHTNSEVRKWAAEERSHLVRALAAICSPAPARSILVTAVSEGLLDSLMSVFPTPRRELGEITPLTVVLMPADFGETDPTSALSEAARALLMGNAARCLMPFADLDGDLLGDSSNYATRLFDPHLLAVEKLICAMATVTDIRVRKNISILLAKGCRVADVKARVSHLRGIQMMIELQNQLI